jgi:branched-chain amino acid transport system ATP-binding protein
MPDDHLLAVSNVVVGYGRKRVIHELSMHLEQGECVALLGANGAGKSTLLNALCGLLRPTSGRIVVAGTDVAGWPSHRIGRGYIALVPEGRRVFTEQTIEANLILGAFHLRRRPERVKELLNETLQIFPVLARYRDRTAAALSGGEQQMLAIGRALMADSKVLLLDEPSLGLSPMMVDEVFEHLSALRGQSRSIMVVEQRVGETLAISDRAYIIERGQVVMEGTSAEIRGSNELVNAYLGEDLSLA